MSHSPTMDRVADVSRFLREHVRTDKADLLLKLVEQFPDVSGDQIQAALNSRRPILILTQAQADDAG